MTSAVRSTSASQVAKDEPRIRVRGLGKHYGSLEVFRNIDFDVGEREIVAIVGPSGCGKTTLLRCIDGLLSHDAGEIWVGAERVTEPIAGVAMVFQHFGLFPWKTVFENVAYGLRMAGAPKAEIERKVPEFIKLVGPHRLREMHFPIRCPAACSNAAVLLALLRLNQTSC